MNEMRPLTRRELREREQREHAAAAEAPSAQPAPASPEKAAPVPAARGAVPRVSVQDRSAPVAPARVPAKPAPTRRQLRETRSPAEALSAAPLADERTAARRPVVAPTMTGSLPVVDPTTGTMAALTIDIPAERTPKVSAAPVAPPAPAPTAVAPLPAAAPSRPAAPAPLPAAAPSRPAAPAPPLTPAPSPAAVAAAAGGGSEVRWHPVSSAAAPPARTSVQAPRTPVPVAPAPPAEAPEVERRSLRTVGPPAGPQEPSPASLTVEEAALSRTSGSALAGAIRLAVLALGAFLIGALIWLVVDGAGAQALSDGLDAFAPAAANSPTNILFSTDSFPMQGVL